ncbi:MAG TPA: HD domain-containing protein [Clostridiaceae bacterium]|nr:HD domain-containing protein [Clostridiaceae bacterium]
MINKDFLQFLFEAASMQRWNDHIRPHKGFTELDKQAQKMFYAYVLAKYEESDRKASINWVNLIEGSMFELFHRILLTDIKPPIFHELMAKKEKQLNQWVIEGLRSKGVYDIKGNFKEKIKEYFFNPGYSAIEKKILKAAHYMATNWEFQIVYRLSSGFWGLEETKNSIDNELEEHYDLAGVQRLNIGKKTKAFLDLIGQLRFQQRWAQAPRVPETSVMGHMLIVAILSYVFTVELEGCNKRIYNNYFAGLFHDLPEVLTRDIISPVKRSIQGLSDVIKEIEERQVEEKIFPLIPQSWHDELRYFTKDEFKSKIIKEGQIIEVDSEDINREYNIDMYNPMDGQIIEVCDKLSAYMEACMSINHGIKSPFLEEGRRVIFDRFKDSKVAGIDFGQLFRNIIVQ